MWVSSLLQHQHFGWIGQGHYHGPLSATWQADCSTVSQSSGNCSTASSCAAEDVVSPWQTSSPLRGRHLAVVKHDTFKVEWMLRADSMASSVTGSNFNGFFRTGTPEQACLVSSYQDHHRSCGTTSSSCNTGQCRHAEACSRDRMLCGALPCALKWTEAPLNCNLVAPMDWPSDKPVANECDVYLENQINKDSYRGEPEREFHSILYVLHNIGGWYALYVMLW
jgi:hypothetical protein